MLGDEASRPCLAAMLCRSDKLLFDVLWGDDMNKATEGNMIHTKHSVFSRTTMRSIFGFSSGFAATYKEI